MAAIMILNIVAPKFVALLIGASPEFDRTCKVLAIGRPPRLITAALLNLVSTAPPGTLTTQDVGSLRASVLFLSVWVTFQRPIHWLRDMLQPRRLYLERAVALVETALSAPESPTGDGRPPSGPRYPKGAGRFTGVRRRICGGGSTLRRHSARMAAATNSPMFADCHRSIDGAASHTEWLSAAHRA